MFVCRGGERGKMRRALIYFLSLKGGHLFELRRLTLQLPRVTITEFLLTITINSPDR